MLFDAIYNGLQELLIRRGIGQTFQIQVLLLTESRLTHLRRSDKVIHPGKKYLQLKRLGYISVGARFIAGNTVLNTILSRKYDNRYMIETQITFHTRTKFPTIGIGQHDITNDDIHLIILQLIPGLLPVCGCQYSISFPEHLFHNEQQFRIVINQQDSRFIHLIRRGIIFHGHIIRTGLQHHRLVKQFIRRVAFFVNRQLYSETGALS